MQQYNKEQLTGMSPEELREVAEGLGLKTSGQDTMDLVYAILDQSAMQSASDSAKNAAPAKRRTRVKTTDRVYTANKDKAKKTDKTAKREADDAASAAPSDKEKGPVSTIQNPVPEPQQDGEADPAAKKRGRKPVTKSKQKADSAADDSAAAPAKAGGRKAAAQPADDFVVMEFAPADAAQPVAPAPAPEAENAAPKKAEAKKDEAKAAASAPRAAKPAKAAGPKSDFIILQDLPVIDYAPQQYAAPSYADASYRRPVAEPRPMPTPAMPAAGYNEPAAPYAPQRAKAFDFGGLLLTSGVLETVDSYGFLRSSDYNYLPSPDDVYITQMQIKHYGLKMGDVVEGHVRPPKTGEKFFTMADITRVNGGDPQAIRDRVAFEFLTPLFPDVKYKLCQGDGNDSQSCRIVDLFAPIGKGQRALIVAQPKTGKTLLMKDIANSIARNHPEAYLIMLLIDERPEEVTDMARTVNAEVIASTFDAPAENHVKIAGLVLEKAKRMVESGQDVVIFLDSITRLARAYNTVSPGSGKVLTGGVDANALQRPKRFFGAARNIEGGGSLTIVATALIDTGSKMDEVIFEEFKGTGNMELQLDRTLSNKRVFPAVNLVASSTRRDDLLQDQTTLNRMQVIRQHIADMTPMEAMTLIKDYMGTTKSNEELLVSINS